MCTHSWGSEAPPQTDVYTLSVRSVDSGGKMGVLGGVDGQFHEKLGTTHLVTHSLPPTPKGLYKLLGVSGPTPKDVHTLYTAGGLWTHPTKDVHRLGA